VEFNKLLASQFADFMRRRFGEDIDVSSIAPELIPVLALQADRPEWLLLMGDLPLSLALTQALNAGQNSAIQIRNPPGSNVLVMVDEAEASADVGTTLALTVQQISGGNMTNLAGTNIGRDTRTGGNRGIAQLSSQNNVAGINIAREVVVGVNVPWVWRNIGIVLAPGSAAQITTSALNVNLLAGFTWRERRVRPEELTA
jgi:hypothetical protein